VKEVLKNKRGVASGVHRRRFLRGAAAAPFVTSGCLDRAGADGPITAREFEILEHNPPGPHDDDPAVEFRPADRQVVVTGKMETGNPCKRAAPLETTYDTNTDSLAVTVGTKKTRDLVKRVTGCPDSLETVRYRLTVTFEERLPGTVVATEIPAPSGERRRVTVER
jgi:hypothetical protein